MYIEITHDVRGKVVDCYVADTLPAAGGDKPLVRYKNGVPAGLEQVRINLDTLTAMEIEAAIEQKAVIDPETGKPVIQQLDRAKYILQNFSVDKTKNVAVPSSVKMPAGMKMRALKRKPA